jgi:two-component system, OmpR family, sensor histidine kinase ResE
MWMPVIRKLPHLDYGIHSLVVRISLMLVLMTLLVFAVGSSALIVFDRQKNLADIYRNGETFATFSALPIYDNYAQFYTHPEPSDFRNFKQNVSAIMSHDTDIRQVEMVSTDGRVLFSSDEFQQGKYAAASPRVLNDPLLLNALDRNTTSRVQLTISGHTNTFIVAPIQAAGDSHFASMVYLLSFDSLHTKLLGSLKELSFTGIPLVILMTVAAFLFAITLVRPILELTKVAERLRGGDLEVRAKADQEDEVGRLALTLNEMAAKIQQNITTLRKDRAQLRSSMNSVDVGLIIIDNDNNVFLTNAEAEHILSYEVDANGVSKPGEPRYDWTTEAIADKLGQKLDFKKALEETKRKGQNTQYPEVDFNGRMLRIFIAPIIDSEASTNQVMGMVALIEDITEQKILERSKDEFFSLASHELRTPLTAIRGNTSMVQTYYKEALKDQSLKELVADTHEASIRLIGIVNDFLDVSRAEQGKMSYKLTSFAIEEVVSGVLKDMSNVLQEKQVTATFQPVGLKEDLVAYADKDRIVQVLYNLIGNAAKFTPPHGTITIAAEAKDQLLTVRVTDTGEGISPNLQQLLFHKFQQAGNSLLTRNTQKGTGLGLYICRLMLEQMGGSIKLESSVEGRGSTFMFTIPRFKQ